MTLESVLGQSSSRQVIVYHFTEDEETLPLQNRVRSARGEASSAINMQTAASSLANRLALD